MNESSQDRIARSDKAAHQRSRAHSATGSQGAVPLDLDLETRRRMVAEAAYYLAERRRFEPGLDMDDWVEAERQIETAVSPG
jgi:hypothetical protein